MVRYRSFVCLFGTALALLWFTEVCEVSGTDRLLMPTLQWYFHPHIHFSLFTRPHYEFPIAMKDGLERKFESFVQDSTHSGSIQNKRSIPGNGDSELDSLEISCELRLRTDRIVCVVYPTSPMFGKDRFLVFWNGHLLVEGVAHREITPLQFEISSSALGAFLGPDDNSSSSLGEYASQARVTALMATITPSTNDGEIEYSECLGERHGDVGSWWVYCLSPPDIDPNGDMSRLAKGHENDTFDVYAYGDVHLDRRTISIVGSNPQCGGHMKYVGNVLAHRLPVVGRSGLNGWERRHPATMIAIQLLTAFSPLRRCEFRVAHQPKFSFHDSSSGALDGERLPSLSLSLEREGCHLFRGDGDADNYGAQAAEIQSEHTTANTQSQSRTASILEFGLGYEFHAASFPVLYGGNKPAVNDFTTEMAAEEASSEWASHILSLKEQPTVLVLHTSNDQQPWAAQPFAQGSFMWVASVGRAAGYKVVAHVDRAVVFVLGSTNMSEIMGSWKPDHRDDKETWGSWNVQPDECVFDVTRLHGIEAVLSRMYEPLLFNGMSMSELLQTMRIFPSVASLRHIASSDAPATSELVSQLSAQSMYVAVTLYDNSDASACRWPARCTSPPTLSQQSDAGLVGRLAMLQQSILAMGTYGMKFIDLVVHTNTDVASQAIRASVVTFASVRLDVIVHRLETLPDRNPLMLAWASRKHLKDAHESKRYQWFMYAEDDIGISRAAFLTMAEAAPALWNDHGLVPTLPRVEHADDGELYLVDLHATLNDNNDGKLGGFDVEGRASVCGPLQGGTSTTVVTTASGRRWTRAVNPYMGAWLLNAEVMSAFIADEHLWNNGHSVKSLGRDGWLVREAAAVGNLWLSETEHRGAMPHVIPTQPRNDLQDHQVPVADVFHRQLSIAEVAVFHMTNDYSSHINLNQGKVPIDDMIKCQESQ